MALDRLHIRKRRRQRICTWHAMQAAVLRRLSGAFIREKLAGPSFADQLFPMVKL